MYRFWFCSLAVWWPHGLVVGAFVYAFAVVCGDALPLSVSLCKIAKEPFHRTLYWPSAQEIVPLDLNHVVVEEYETRKCN